MARELKKQLHDSIPCSRPGSTEILGESNQIYWSSISKDQNYCSFCIFCVSSSKDSKKPFNCQLKKKLNYFDGDWIKQVDFSGNPRKRTVSANHTSLMQQIDVKNDLVFENVNQPNLWLNCMKVISIIFDCQGTWSETAETKESPKVENSFVQREILESPGALRHYTLDQVTWKVQ